MPSPTAIHHATRVNSIVSAAPDPRGIPPDRAIAQSWSRCIQRYRLDPAEPHETLVLENARLRERQERLEDVLDIARFEMNNLYRQISGSGYAILLTNSEGVIVNSVSDPTLVDTFTRSGLWLGASWNEKHEGTNGIGTCIMEKQPLTIHRDEHFHSRNIHLTCSASPIFDPYGNLLAVLDASSTSSNDSKQSQFHTVALVTISAKMIENCHFLHHFRDKWVLRFHNRPEFVGMLSEGMLAFDAEGKILAANQSALNQLQKTGGGPLIRQGVGEVFDVRLDTLMERAAYQSSMVWPVRDRCGRSYFARLRGAGHRSSGSESIVAKKTVNAVLEPPPETLGALAGEDPAMLHIARCAGKVVNRDVNILLIGETGTGKEAVARGIHAISERANKPFVAVNCASIPESLIESELFGYQHGAFTGARREGMRGKILQSSGGTLFLDEIGDMPPPLQTRLLRVLEEKEVVPLGCEKPQRVDLHVISATHRNIQERLASAEFREDLYYRLNGLVLALPALRERQDKSRLIHSILRLESKGEDLEIHEEAFAALDSYPWPGNIRQLRNVLRTAAALCDGGMIRLEDLPREIAQAGSREPGRLAPGPAVAPSEDRHVLSVAERNALLRTLENHRWNITDTSLHLGISRNTLYRKMKKHGIPPPTIT